MDGDCRPERIALTLVVSLVMLEERPQIDAGAFESVPADYVSIADVKALRADR
jgi:hypothetical protein